ncbi:MAG: HAMP domain-containing histidine kinase [Oscillibacter sp.]|nr:HAMP domain-containing histidine kinase [Oscillibacter sp.]
MEPLKRRWRNLSLRKTLVVYITAAALLAVVLCEMTNDLCGMEIREIHAGYLDSMEKYYLTNERGERMGDGTYIGTDAFPLSPEDQRTVDILRALPRVTTPVWSALCILGAALLFYRNKLKRPLAELRLASEKISQNDLDFTVVVHNRDELGQLCASFETMRASLAQNFSEMWRQMEERKRLNAAFAHDLRTPLTVLKGHNEMLQFSGDEQTRATAVTMQRHISRLEHYVDTMSQLRRLEDTQPVYRQTPLKVLVASLYESGTILCEQAGKRFSMENRITSLSLPLDGDLISRVYGNLIANAVRYAASQVELCLEETAEGLLLSVSDDGPGFDKNSLEKATEPYFTGEKADHFGLGLYTSKLLCEHHGGWLRIENTVSGAKVTVFFKSR